jgi:hypothetical protein
MRIHCPKCKQEVPAAQINVAADLALCPQCNEGFRVSECLDLDTVTADVLENPPKGAWLKRELDRVVVGATTRSPIAFFLVPFMCVWSGFSLVGIYGSQIASGKFNLTSSLFGIPFVLGSILFWAFALMAVCGKVEVTIGRTSAVFVGIGTLGWTRRFDWAAVRGIREEGSGVEYPGGQQKAIVMELEKGARLKFGSGLNETRRRFLAGALKHLRSMAGAGKP